jgi:hypothetical protein
MPINYYSFLLTTYPTIDSIKPFLKANGINPIKIIITLTDIRAYVEDTLLPHTYRYVGIGNDITIVYYENV